MHTRMTTQFCNNENKVGLTNSKLMTMSSPQPLPTSSMMDTPMRLMPDDCGTFEFLLQMGYTPQAVILQMIQASMAAPAVAPTAASTTASTTTPATASVTAPAAAQPMVQEGNQQPSTNGMNIMESDEEEVEQPAPPAPPPAFSDNTPYSAFALGVRPTLGVLWKHYNPTRPFNT